ncbi:MAG: lysostaphin resistance A-like protein [Pleurocapsa sp.]
MSEIVFASEDDMLLPKLLKMFNTSWFKVLTFFEVWSVLWLPIAFVVSRSIDWQPNEPLIPKQKLILLASLYLLSPIVLGWKIALENLSFISIGLNLDVKLFTSILLGLVIGLASLIIVFAFESIFNLVSWHRQNSPELFSLLLPILVLSLFISLIEEFIFRGYVFNTLVSDYSYWISAIVSSLIFAALHLIWERKETLPQIPGLWLMGMILVGAEIVNRGSLGLAIGLHASWIWGLTCIDSAQLLTYERKNSWLTGFNQQPLAGIAGMSCLAITGFALWLAAYNNFVW